MNARPIQAVFERFFQPRGVVKLAIRGRPLLSACWSFERQMVYIALPHDNDSARPARDDANNS